MAEKCIGEDIPLLVESVAYPTTEEKNNPDLFAKHKPELVIEAAGKLTSLPIDILKSEFPADINYEKDEAKLASYCQELSRVSRLPWVLLSAGIDFERFRKRSGDRLEGRGFRFYGGACPLAGSYRDKLQSR